jgi:hypothetical protein
MRFNARGSASLLDGKSPGQRSKRNDVQRQAIVRILVLLADTSLVLEPNFYLADVDRFFARDFIQARWELFLKSSIAPSACA